MTTKAEIRARGVERTAAMAAAMYEVDNACVSHRDAVAFLFASADTKARYATMAQAARRVIEQGEASDLAGMIGVEGELRAELVELRRLVDWLLRSATALDDIPPGLSVYLRALATNIGFDHGGRFNDATD
jgi:uncharacterized protein (UPF0261 family)